MTLEDAAGDLLRHMEWADALIWTAVLESPVAATDRALQDRLYHIHVTQHAFLQVWRGLESELPAAATLDIRAMARWAQAFYAAATADTSWLGSDRLGDEVPDSLVSKAHARLGPGAMTPRIGDTLWQVVLHTAHHRGQASTRLREVGCDAPLLEYFVWVWQGKPAARWPV